MRRDGGSLPMVVSQNFPSATSLAMLAPMRTLMSIPSFSWIMSEISLSPSGPSSTPWETTRDRDEHLLPWRPGSTCPNPLIHSLRCNAPTPIPTAPSALRCTPLLVALEIPHVPSPFSSTNLPPNPHKDSAPASRSPHTPPITLEPSFCSKTPGFPLQPLQARLLPAKPPWPGAPASCPGSAPPAHTLMSDTPTASFFTWPLSWSQTCPTNWWGTTNRRTSAPAQAFSRSGSAT